MPAAGSPPPDAALAGVPLVEASGLTKRFGRVRALDGLDLAAVPGEVLAVLGPNGAGKSTFLRAVATLVRPSAGSLRVAGIDAIRHPQGVRRIVGLAGQSASVDEELSGAENLRLVARLFGHGTRAARAQAAAVLERLDLVEAGDRLVRTYSGGMRRRLDLGASLVGAPRLLLLDEPTTGLDPRSRNEVWATVQALVAGGTDVLLTTQYLDEADHLAQRIAIVDRGRVIASGTPAELKERAGRAVVEVRPRHVPDLVRAAGALARLGVEPPRVDEVGRRLTVAVQRGTERLVDAVRLLDERGIAIDDVALRRPTLDEVFLELTGHAAGPTDGTDPPDRPGPRHRRSRAQRTNDRVCSTEPQEAHR